MTGVAVKVEATGNEVLVLVAGDVDMANIDVVEAELLAAITNRVTVATIDLTDVTYLDSAGLRLLFGLATRLPLLQITLRLVAPRGSPARRVIELSGLATLTQVDP